MIILKEILKKRNITAKRLEELTDLKGKKVSEVSIGKILRGETSPRVSTLESIADALDIKVVDLFGVDVSEIENKEALQQAIKLISKVENKL